VLAEGCLDVGAWVDAAHSAYRLGQDAIDAMLERGSVAWEWRAGVERVMMAGRRGDIEHGTERSWAVCGCCCPQCRRAHWRRAAEGEAQG
jgi:hypothetical protein